MSVKIRLKKFGAKKRPYYRVVVMDSRLAREGATLEEIGTYHPIKSGDAAITIDEAKVRAWLAKGALPSDTVRSLLNKKNIRLG
ncbi:MAG TPA: 30S ribosomal protein S16 [Magnetospirillaceae bacterium]|nr:30S ribosomal protein S16 [Magnetospirillaceae bacterium]